MAMAKDINTIKGFLKLLVECELNRGGCITIPKSVANDLIEYIDANEKFKNGAKK